MNTLITIKDIANQLNISPSTVSRALQDHPDISVATKKKIVELAEQMGYQPNALAMSLRKKRSHVIGIIVPEIVHHFFSSVISGIDQIAYDSGYNILISQSNESFQREKHNLQTLISSRVDGILISCTRETTETKHIENALNSNIPVVFFDRVIPNIQIDQVIIDDKRAAFEATEYLIKTGCRRIAHYKGPASLTISHNRLNGFLAALDNYNVPVNNDLIVECDNFDDAERITIEMIRNNALPDAIFTVNDMTALGAISALNKYEIKIPEQVSIMGFTNGLSSRFSNPALSTVEQNGFLMGNSAANRLLQRIKTGDIFNPAIDFIPTELVIRESTRKLL